MSGFRNKGCYILSVWVYKIICSQQNPYVDCLITSNSQMKKIRLNRLTQPKSPNKLLAKLEVELWVFLKVHFFPMFHVASLGGKRSRGQNLFKIKIKICLNVQKRDNIASLRLQSQFAGLIDPLFPHQQNANIAVAYLTELL